MDPPPLPPTPTLVTQNQTQYLNVMICSEVLPCIWGSFCKFFAQFVIVFEQAFGALSRYFFAISCWTFNLNSFGKDFVCLFVKKKN